MTPFELVEPRSLGEAIRLLDRDDPAVRPIAGGTALMLMMKSGLFRPIRLVSLRSIGEGFSRIAIGADGVLRIGALASLAAVERSPLVERHSPVVVRTLRTLSNIRVRAVATVGGHLAHADPHLDLPPVLIALGAHVSVAGPAGERMIPVDDLAADYYETVLRHDELITELAVPPPAEWRAAYLKCTTRSANDWPALGVAVSLRTDGSTIHGVRVAVGAATAKPMRLGAAESVLHGAGVDDSALRRAGEAAADEATLVADQRGSAAYKKQLLRVHVVRAVRLALAATPGRGASPR